MKVLILLESEQWLLREMLKEEKIPGFDLEFEVEAFRALSLLKEQVFDRIIVGVHLCWLTPQRDYTCFDQSLLPRRLDGESDNRWHAAMARGWARFGPELFRIMQELGVDMGKVSIWTTIPLGATALGVSEIVEGRVFDKSMAVGELAAILTGKARKVGAA